MIESSGLRPISDARMRSRSIGGIELTHDAGSRRRLADSTDVAGNDVLPPHAAAAGEEEEEDEEEAAAQVVC